MTMTMMFGLEQVLVLSALHQTQCKIIGDDNDYDNGDENDDLGIGTGVRAFGNAPTQLNANLNKVAAI